MIIKRKLYSLAGYAAGAIGGDIIGTKVGGAIGSAIKKRPSEFELESTKDRLKLDKKLLEKLKSGKPIKAGELYLTSICPTIIPSDDKLNKPEEREKNIKKLEKSIEKQEYILNNKDKKVSNNSKLGSFIGGVAGTGAGVLVARKLLK